MLLHRLVQFCCKFIFGLRRRPLILVLLTSASLFLLHGSIRSLFEPAYEPPCSSLSERFPDSIPPIVHWTSKEYWVSIRQTSIVKSWRRLMDIRFNGSRASWNSTDSDGFHLDRWHFMHWDDRQISELISKHYPQLSRSYSKLVNGLERSDIGRLVVLHHIGGLYVDTDVELLRDPSPLLRPLGLHAAGLSANFSCQSAVWSQEPQEHAAFIFNISSMISNAVMMSRANHSFLNFVLNNWPSWFEDRWAKNRRRSFNQAVYVTGPIMLQSFYEKYIALQPGEQSADWCGNMLAEADAFQPLCDSYYGPSRMKSMCSNTKKLSDLQKQHCKRLSDEKFKAKQIPKSAYTVHKFLHLSYTNNMHMVGASKISSILPILRCTL